MNILLVEPDMILAKAYFQALTGAGHEVVCCSNAQQAIFAADKMTPDLVLLELQLVSHSGIEFLYEFHSYGEWQEIPAIVLSHVPPAEFMDSWELLQQELGVAEYLYKPHTTLAKLLQAVDNLQPAVVQE